MFGRWPSATGYEFEKLTPGDAVSRSLERNRAYVAKFGNPKRRRKSYKGIPDLQIGDWDIFQYIYEKSPLSKLQ